MGLFTFLKNKRPLTSRKENSMFETISFEFHLIAEWMEKKFSYPMNSDFTKRKLKVQSLQREAILYYLSSMVDLKSIEENVIRPLMEETGKERSNIPVDVLDSIISSHKVKQYNNLLMR